MEIYKAEENEQIVMEFEITKEGVLSFLGGALFTLLLVMLYFLLVTYSNVNWS